MTPAGRKASGTGAAKAAAKKPPKAAATPAKSARARKASPVKAVRATKAAPAKTVAAAGRGQAPKPHGRDEVIQSIIDATLSLWTAKGTSELSLRSIASRAGVNYGLVHRHFGTKEAVIRAAMDAVVTRSLGFIEDSTDLMDAIDQVLPRSTGAHARLVAWTILQYVVDDVLPEEDVFLGRLRKLAVAGAANDEEQIASAVTAGSLIAMLYGWRLFEPYITRGLGLQNVPHDKLDALIRAQMLTLVKSQPGIR